MATIANLAVKLTANISGFTAGMHRAITPLRQLGASVASTGSKVAALTTAVGGGALVTGVAGLGTWAVKLAADAEQARVSFTTMLGSAEAAKALMAQIQTFAASTPFQTDELVQASKALLAFGVAQDQIIPTMRTLGDLSAGLGIPLGELAEIYGKARVQGRLFAQDVNQLTGRGIPVIQEFAKQFGVTEAKVRELVESGQINFSHLQRALVSLTGEGGKFSGLMAAQSRTVAGLFSTLQDTVTLNLTRIGEVITDKLDLRAALGGITEAISAMASAAMPILEGFIGRLAESGNIGKRAGEIVLTASEWIATGLAYVIDYSQLLVAGFRLMQAGATVAVLGLVKSVDLIGKGIVKLLNLLPGVKLEWTTFFNDLSNDLIIEAGKLTTAAGQAFENFQNGDSADRVSRFFQQVRQNAQQAAQATADAGQTAAQATMKIEQAAATQNEKVGEMLAKLRQQIAEFNMTDAQKLAEEMRRAGATDAQIQEGTGLQAQLDAMEQARKRQEDLQQKARSLAESLATPMERYEQTIGELNDMLSAGAIGWELYAKGVQKARQELESTGGEIQSPDAMQVGTAQAQRFVWDMTTGQQRLTRDEIPRKQLAEAQESTRLLERIEANTKSGGGTLTVLDM